MLYQYRFKNLWSFAGEARISFMLNRHTPETDAVFKSPGGTRLSKLMAVQGANGAGKTSALKVLPFLSWFVERSFASHRWTSMVIGKHVFAKEKDSEIEAEFEHEGEHYRYRLVANAEHVVHESLHSKTSASFSYLFHRDLTKSGHYAVRQKGFYFPKKQAGRVGSKVSLISAAAQYNVPRALKLADYFGRISTNINLNIPGDHFNEMGDLAEAARFFQEHPELRRAMVKFMSRAGLGLSDVKIEMVPRSGKKTAADACPFGVHLQGRRSFKLSLEDESKGTRTTFALLRRMLPVLARGGIAVIDELDAGLHPDLVMALLGLFTDADSNPYHAQIIFTSYVPDVMDTLLKEQLLFVEKSPGGHSEAWRLDDIKGIRRDENYYGKYRAGAYGAIPNI